MTEAEKNYKNGKFNPYPIMKKYGDIIDNLGEIIEDNLNPIGDTLVELSVELPQYMNELKYDAESLAGKLDAITSSLYRLVDDCDYFNERIYHTAYRAGKKDYLESKSLPVQE